MAVLSRDAILAQKKLKQETVSVPEWGGDVIVRELMADEADVFESGFAAARAISSNGGSNQPDPNKFQSFRAKIVALSAIDEDGKRLFSDDDISALGQLSRSALDRVSTVAMRLSGYSEDALKKNSPVEGVSSSVSPSPSDDGTLTSF